MGQGSIGKLGPAGATESSYLEASFDLMLRTQGKDIPPPVAEYKFHSKRRWRFDFAWPLEKVAVEIEGLTREGGRHQRPEGFRGDCEKYEAALLAGWRVYRIPGNWVAIPNRHVWKPRILDTLGVLLGVR